MPASDPFPVLCLLQSHLEALAGRGQRRMWLNEEARQALREIVRMKPRPWTPEMVAAAAAAASSSAETAITGPETETASEMQAAFMEAPETEAWVASPPSPADEDNPVKAASETPQLGAAIPAPAAGPMPVSGVEENRPSTPANGSSESVPRGDEEWNDACGNDAAAEALPGMAAGSASSGGDASRLSLTLVEKEAGLAAVRGRAEEGRAARALGTLRSRMVFAVGRADAEIVFVGEAPGAEEERLGEPFVGPAGQLLNRILNAMGLQRGEVYISNICKFRPEMENQGSRNRQPSGLEMASCMDFVREEIRIIQPKVVVALGATAAAGLLGIKSGVMSARGRFYEFEGIPAMVTLHPSYLLHREKDGPDIANAEKRKVWEDMLQVMERAGLPVSDKQRRFFLPR